MPLGNIFYYLCKVGCLFSIILEVLIINELEEKVYKEIKNELVQSIIDKKIDNYITNRNELTHYYNVGKMIVSVQGGDEKAEYGNNLIKKYSKKLTSELGKGYSITSLKYMRQFYLFAKSQPLVDQSISWSHYTILMTLDNQNEINYYIKQIAIYH